MLLDDLDDGEEVDESKAAHLVEVIAKVEEEGERLSRVLRHPRRRHKLLQHVPGPSGGRLRPQGTEDDPLVDEGHDALHALSDLVGLFSVEGVDLLDLQQE